MAKLGLLLFAAGCVLTVLGCSGGDVTADMQKAKKDALQKVADSKKGQYPVRAPRTER